MKYDYNLFKNYLIFDGLSEDEIKKFIDLMKFKKYKIIMWIDADAVFSRYRDLRDVLDNYHEFYLVSHNVKIKNAPSFVWPAKGKIIKSFGKFGKGQHYDGIDIMFGKNQPIYSLGLSALDVFQSRHQR